MKAIGYVRVSTEDQAQSGISLEAQEEKIRAYCLAKGWDLLKVIKDGAIRPRISTALVCRKSSTPAGGRSLK